MRKNLSWNELLILGGFLPKGTEQDEFVFYDESIENVEFLRDILNKLAAKYELRFESLRIFSQPVLLDEWVTALMSVGGKCCEFSSNPDDLDLRILDVSMLGIVRQLNRLGLLTRFSCEGHGKKNPCVQLIDHNIATKAYILFRELGVAVKRKGINVDESELRLTSIIDNININAVKYIKLIHGYHSGTSLRDLVRESFKHYKICEVYFEIENPGVTHFELSEAKLKLIMKGSRR